MRETYILEIHKTSRSPSRKPARSCTAHKGYWRINGPKRRIRRLEKKMRRKGFRTLSYSRELKRSSKCREKYFAAAKPVLGLYRCVYCGRLMTKDKVVVDHVIPVARAKAGRLPGYLKGGINSRANLVASCFRCNGKKGDKAGLWVIRARLGRLPGYFLFRDILFLCAMGMVLHYICRFLAH